MNVSLTPEMENWIQGRVKSGLYQSSSEVVRASLRLLQEREDLMFHMTQELRNDINAGINDIEQNKSTIFDQKVLQRIKKTGRKRMAGKP